MREQLGDTTGQNTSETVKVQRDRTYSQQVFNIPAGIYEDTQCKQVQLDLREEETVEAMAIGGEVRAPGSAGLSLDRLLRSEQPTEECQSKDEILVRPFREMSKHCSMVKPTLRILEQAEAPFSRLPSELTALPGPTKRIGERNLAPFSIAESETFLVPSLKGGA